MIRHLIFLYTVHSAFYYINISRPLAPVTKLSFNSIHMYLTPHAPACGVLSFLNFEVSAFSISRTKPSHHSCVMKTAEYTSTTIISVVSPY